jgi:hypothetical protein
MYNNISICTTLSKEQKKKRKKRKEGSYKLLQEDEIAIADLV